MSSSQPFLASSPFSPAASGRRRKSRFTYKHLAQLALSSTTCPLRVIAHIDLDAFYAQCEGVRLGIPEQQPLAVQVGNLPYITSEASADTETAMARAHCDQLSGQEVWSQQAHHDYGSKKTLSRPDHATCGHLEGRR